MTSLPASFKQRRWESLLSPHLIYLILTITSDLVDVNSMRMRQKIAAIFGCWFVVATANGQTNERSEMALGVDMEIIDLQSPRAVGTVATQLPRTPLSERTIRFHLRVINAADKKWKVVVEGLSQEGQLETITPEDFFQG